MFLLLLLRFVIVVLSLMFVITQFLVPLVTGTILFPMFRKSREELLKEQTEIKAQLDDQEIASSIQTLKNELDGKKNPPDASPSEKIVP